MADVVRLPGRIDLGRPWKSFYPSQILERPPPPTWVLDGLILAGEVTLLAGDAKIGKSLLAQQLLSCAALGLPCIGHHMECTRTFGYFCEDTNDWLVRRQFDICEALGIEMLEFKDFFAWQSRAQGDCILANFEFGRMQLTGEWDHLWREIDDFGAGLVVIDTARAVFSGNERSPSQVTPFMRALSAKAIEGNRAIVLNVHPAKSEKGGFGGTLAWHASARNALSLRRPSTYDEETDEPRFERVLAHLGANYAGRGKPEKLLWKDGVFVTDEPDPPPPRAFGLFSQGILDGELLEGLRKCRRNGAAVPADVLAAGSLPRRYRATFDRRTSLNDLYSAQERIIAAGKVLRVGIGGRCLLRPADGFPYPGEEVWHG